MMRVAVHNHLTGEEMLPTSELPLRFVDERVRNALLARVRRSATRVVLFKHGRQVRRLCPQPGGGELRLTALLVTEGEAAETWPLGRQAHLDHFVNCEETLRQLAPRPIRRRTCKRSRSDDSSRRRAQEAQEHLRIMDASSYPSGRGELDPFSERSEPSSAYYRSRFARAPMDWNRERLAAMRAAEDSDGLGAYVRRCVFMCAAAGAAAGGSRPRHELRQRRALALEKQMFPGNVWGKRGVPRGPEEAHRAWHRVSKWL